MIFTFNWSCDCADNLDGFINMTTFNGRLFLQWGVCVVFKSKCVVFMFTWDSIFLNSFALLLSSVFELVVSMMLMHSACSNSLKFLIIITFWFVLNVLFLHTFGCNNVRNVKSKNIIDVIRFVENYGFKVQNLFLRLLNCKCPRTP